MRILLRGIAIVVVALAMAAAATWPARAEDRESDSGYQSELGGFRIEFPPSWVTARWSARDVGGPRAEAYHPLAIRAVEFFYQPLAATDPPRGLATVLVLDRGKYYRAPVEMVPSPEFLLEETADRVFFGYVPGQNPWEPGSPDAEIFESMRLTTGWLRSAFSILAEAAGGGREPVRKVVTGKVTSPQRVLLFSTDVLEVYLLDLSSKDAPSEVIGSIRMGNLSQLPVDFILSYQASKVQPLGTYVLTARILRDGTLKYRSKSQQPVLTWGNPRHAELVLVPADVRP
jgi:uncharacterized lipoprotein YbaY